MVRLNNLNKSAIAVAWYSVFVTLIFMGCLHSSDGEKDNSTIINPTINGIIQTDTDGAIIGGKIRLTKYKSMTCDSSECIELIDSTYSDSVGKYSFPSLTPGVYSLFVNWTIGRITRNHEALEMHGEFMVIHASNGIENFGMAYAPNFELNSRDTTISFVYEN